MATGGDNATDYNRAIISNEMFEHRHIVRDLGTLLGSMKEKIDGLEDEEEQPNSDSNTKPHPKSAGLFSLIPPIISGQPQ